MNRMKRIFATLVLASSLIFAPGVSMGALAASASSQDACAGIGVTGTSCSDKSATNGVNNLLSTIVNILSMIVGIVSVIMVIVAGLKYVTSGGDSNGITSAKNTLIYALVGLAIAAMAQFLVRFVLSKVAG